MGWGDGGVQLPEVRLWVGLDGRPERGTRELDGYLQRTPLTYTDRLSGLYGILKRPDLYVLPFIKLVLQIRFSFLISAPRHFLPILSRFSFSNDPKGSLEKKELFVIV